MDLPAVIDSLFTLLEKAASELDAADAKAKVDRERIKDLSLRLQEKSATAAYVPPLPALIKMAQVMREENLLAVGADAEKFAAALAADPASLPELVIRLIRPATPQGTPVKAAAEETSQEDPDMVYFDGRWVHDPYGFHKCLRK